MKVPYESQRFLDKLNTSMFMDHFDIKEKGMLLKLITRKGVTISINGTMYVDEDCDITPALVTHEAMHYLDQCVLDEEKDYYIKDKTMFLWFILKYFFPIWLGLILLSVGLVTMSKIMVFASIALVMPNPLLSYMRRRYEMRGYFFNWYMKDHRNYSKIFSSMTYYIMMFPTDKEYFEKEFTKMLNLKKQDERFTRLFIYVKSSFKLK